MRLPAEDFHKDPFGGKGILITDEPNYRCWLGEIDGKLVQCVRERVSPLLDEAADYRSRSQGQRWGDMKRVATIPESMFWDPNSDFSKAHNNRDNEWIKRFLNDIDNQKLRTFEGRL